MNGYTIIGFDPETYSEPVAVRVESRYDRNIRSWVTVSVDDNGYQVGDAAFDGDKAGRDISIRTMEANLSK